MPSLLPNFEYDIFISYRHNDNLDGWVTQFVENLEKELRATIKEPLSIYFDKNPHDGLQQHHEVDDSLREKLKSLILIPIVSQTYCDPKSFAWEHELIPFIQQASEDSLGLKTRVSGGNIASRVLPIKIHEIDHRDKQLFEEATGSVMRSLDFIYKESGVNRPLRPTDDRDRNQEQIDYRNQVNKVANAVKEIINGLQGRGQNVNIEKKSIPGIPISHNSLKSRKKQFRIPTIKKESLLILLSTILALALVLLGSLHFNESKTQSLTYRATILAPKETSFNTAFGGNLALSPDGALLAFVSIDSLGISHLYLRAIDELEARQLKGTEKAFLPFWSPDSRYIGFFTDGKLKKIDVAGGLPQTLCDADMGRGATWNEDGTIIFSPGIFTPLSRVSAAGGRAIPLTNLDSASGSASHRWPFFLPNGKHYLYTSLPEGIIRLASLDSISPKILIPNGTNAEYTNGHIIYILDGTLMAQPFEPNNLHTIGEAFPIAENILYDGVVRKGSFSLSQNGNLVYQTGGLADAGTELAWCDRMGKALGAIKHGDSRNFLTFRISPEGSRVAVSHGQSSRDNTNNIDIWLYEINRDAWSRFTFNSGEDRSPIWSPDGKTIVFASTRNRVLDLYYRASNGAGNEQLLFKDVENSKNLTDWSHDGKFILYHTGGAPKSDIWIMPMENKEPKPLVFLQTEFNEAHATFSPDGRWIAYQSDESGQNEIYIRPFPGPGAKWQVSTTGGTRPHWRGDGKELFYYAANSSVMSVEIQLNQSTVEVGSLKRLFDLPYSVRGYAPNADVYQVTSDGQRFLYESFPDSENGSPITLVINWLGKSKKE